MLILRNGNKDYVEAAKDALASMKDPIEIRLINQSGVLGDSLTTVEEMMQKIRTWYSGRTR